MEKSHYVMRKVLHNNIDSSRLSQEYDAVKYHSNVSRIEFNRTLMPQLSEFVSVRISVWTKTPRIIVNESNNAMRFTLFCKHTDVEAYAQ